MRSKKKRQPATAAERAAVNFKALAIEFDWTNEDWAITYLPQVRIAVTMLQKDKKDLIPLIREIAMKGMIPEALDSLILTRDHLKTLVDAIDMTLARSFVALEIAGFDPEKNIPPETAQSTH